ncbi:tyrosine-type recombinase/integrase [Candidatus Solirubrobacter pratensis]|uniref:tyrosine-type recombinase/integrase n=1 Tax=Candidatus Solirubrobacter pratensis TaxID=1298857 RepID=UPI00042A868A|nr:site-specific integrase [Candidatus Solirubrobacter pratensis]
MPRPLKGSHRVRNGQVYLRFRGDEWCVGSELEWPPSRIDAALEQIVNQYRAGVWTGPPRAEAVTASAGRGPAFSDAAADYLARQKTRGLKRGTLKDIEARIAHLLSFFGDRPLHDIDVALIERYQEHKQREAEYLATVYERYQDGDDTLTEAEVELARYKRTGIGPYLINRTIITLANIIERYRDSSEAAATAMPSNPAQRQSLKLHVPKRRNRSYMEPSQTNAVLDAALLLDNGARSDHRNYPVRVMGRMVMLAVLLTTGIRIHELCNLLRRDVNLEVCKLTIADSKTDAGVREVWFTPWLADLLRAWMFEQETKWTRPDDHLFSASAPDGPRRRKSNMCPCSPSGKAADNRCGRLGRRDESRVREYILAPAVSLADDLLLEAQQSPMPESVTPHTFRRTYITYAAEMGFSIRYIMNQVGHVDSSVTVEVYNQLMVQRNDARIPQWVGTPEAMGVGGRAPVRQAA